LRLTLAPAIEAGYFFNRDERRGRVELLVPGWSPALSTVPREGEIIVRTSAERKAYKGLFPPRPHTRDWYIQEMWRFFTEAHKVLKDDGILIVWFTHSDPEAWEGILGALYAADFMVSKVWTVRTEMATRPVATVGGTAFFSSLAIVARKAKEVVVTAYEKPDLIVEDEELRDCILESLIDAYKSARESKAARWELFVMCLAGAIAGATRIRNPGITMVREQATLEVDIEPEEALAILRFRSQLKYFRDVLYPAAVFLGSRWLLDNALREQLEELKNAGYSEEAIDHLIEDVIASDAYTDAYLLLWHITRYSLEPVVDYDFAEKLLKVLGIKATDLAYYGLVRSRGGKVRVLYGKEVFDALKRRIELLNKTAAGRAIYLTKVVLESPTRMDISKATDYVLSQMPVGRREAAIALFQIGTANEKELEKIGASKATVPFIKSVLRELLGR